MAVHIETLFDTPAHARMHAQAYLNNPQSRHKSDLIEGVFVMASPASWEHEQIVALIISTMSNFVSVHPLGKVSASNAGFRLSEDNVFQPDVAFVRTERLHLVEDDVVFGGAPDIAVEVISPSSRQYDTVEKKINYGRFGVGEYWLIDPIRREAVFYARQGEQLIPLPAEPGTVRSQLLDGYWLRPAWLFPGPGESRPTALEISRAQGLLD